MLRAGIPKGMINVETISPIVGPLGTGKDGSWFYFAHRTAQATDGAALETYVKNPPYKA